MQLFAFILIGLVSAFHGSCGAHKESITSDSSNSRSSHVDALSRSKRGAYDNMLRLSRGLNMLRLGKRGGPSYNQDWEVDYLPSQIDSQYQQLFPDAYFDLQDTYRPANARYRRSTPSEYPMTTLSPLGSDDDVIEGGAEKRGLHMLRLGKKSAYDGLEDGNGYYDQEKRSLNMLRLGKKSIYDGMANDDGYYDKDKKSLNMLRLGKRQLMMLRLGKRNGGDVDMYPILNYGSDAIVDDVDGDYDAEKRSLHMLRLGKRAGLSGLRLGKKSLYDGFSDKDDEYDEEKRSLNMLRLGKRQLPMIRMGKRQGENLNSDFTSTDMEKRALPILRLGKKSDDVAVLNGPEQEKRNLHMLRLGKRNLHMLRLGKRNLHMLRLGKRNLNMLRLGKRQLQMLRLGKRDEDKEQSGEEEKRGLRALRLGKRSVSDTNSDKVKALERGNESPVQTEKVEKE